MNKKEKKEKATTSKAYTVEDLMKKFNKDKNKKRSKR
jgi:hypothetical protein